MTRTTLSLPFEHLLIGALLLLTASGLMAAAPTPQPADNEFHFVVLGDAQFDDPATFNRMVDDVRHLQPAFVIQAGDMIEGYSDRATMAAEWQRFKRQIAPLGDIVFVPVPGNHDLYNADRRAAEDTLALYEQQWGSAYRTFDYRNARFIILNSDAPGEERSIGDCRGCHCPAGQCRSARQPGSVFAAPEPAALPMLQMKPESRESVTVSARYAVAGTPETRPRCSVQVPFQTRHGIWVEFETETLGVIDAP